MSKAGSAAKVKLNSFDDLFGASDMTAGTDQVQEIPDVYKRQDRDRSPRMVLSIQRASLSVSLRV